MPIEKRINGVDLNGPSYNSTYRAALHNKLSAIEPDSKIIKPMLFQDYVQPLSADLTKSLRSLEGKIVNITEQDREIIYLSPLGAFGLNALLTETSSLKIAHVTGRAADVVAEPTVELSAEVYRRRISGDSNVTSLGTIHRVVRLQRYSDPKFTTSFEMFSTIDSSSSGSKYLDEEMVTRHILRYYSFLHDTFPSANIRTTLGNLCISEKFISSEARETHNSKDELLQKFPSQLQHPLQIQDLSQKEIDSIMSLNVLHREVEKMIQVYQKLPEFIQINTDFDLSRILGLGHYNGLAFMMHIDDITIIDGGSVDWVAQLTSNKKEKSVVSGLGLEICARILNQYV